tara:strand:+ start:3953 stop:4126 length:174 start_codon:yes stop_codon:yes gene_type:complete
MHDATSALFDAYDVRAALSDRIKNRPKDSEGSEITIGDCLDDIILFLEGLTHDHTQA